MSHLSILYLSIMVKSMLGFTVPVTAILYWLVQKYLTNLLCPGNLLGNFAWLLVAKTAPVEAGDEYWLFPEECFLGKLRWLHLEHLPICQLKPVREIWYDKQWTQNWRVMKDTWCVSATGKYTSWSGQAVVHVVNTDWLLDFLLTD